MVHLFIHPSFHSSIYPSLLVCIYLFPLSCIFRYLLSRKSRPKPDKDKVIAMSLDSRTDKTMLGAIRNVLLSEIFFPGWTVRAYVPRSPNNSSPLPERMAALVHTHPFQIVYVNNESQKLDPSLWPLLAIEDTTVDYLLVRKPTGRLSDRDAAVVRAWLDSGKIVYVVRIVQNVLRIKLLRLCGA